MHISTIFNELRSLMRAEGYDKQHPAFQSLAQLRKALRDRGYDFSSPEVKNV